jgi:phosphoribosylanthranilate isomerase
MKAKVCGLTSILQVETCVKNKANFCGFILNYKKSHRYIDYDKAKKLTSVNKNNTFYVGVLVDPSDIELDLFSKLNLDYFQIYGEISSDRLLKIKKKYKQKIIIAIQVSGKDDILKFKKYKNQADIILFDSSGLHKSISWNYDWMRKVPSSIVKMVAGNIKMHMLENFNEIADIVDVSGALETNKVKDINKIEDFLIKVKNI